MNQLKYIVGCNSSIHPSILSDRFWGKQGKLVHGIKGIKLNFNRKFVKTEKKHVRMRTQRLKHKQKLFDEVERRKQNVRLDLRGIHRITRRAGRKSLHLLYFRWR
jgi:hypothetical protein